MNYSFYFKIIGNHIEYYNKYDCVCFTFLILYYDSSIKYKVIVIVPI